MLCSIARLNPPSAITVHLPKTSARNRATLFLLKQAAEREDTSVLRAKPDHSSVSAGCTVSFQLNVEILSLPLCVLVSAASMLLADLDFC